MPPKRVLKLLSCLALLPVLETAESKLAARDTLSDNLKGEERKTERKEQSLRAAQDLDLAAKSVLMRDETRGGGWRLFHQTRYIGDYRPRVA